MEYVSLCGDEILPFLKKLKKKSEEAAKKGLDVGEKGVKKGVEVGKKAGKTRPLTFLNSIWPAGSSLRSG